eukprot:8757670-Pyramimonas_sp.AAC.1
MCGSRLSAARILCLNMQEFPGFPWSSYQKSSIRRIQDFEISTVTLIRGVEVPGIAFWHD